VVADSVSPRGAVIVLTVGHTIDLASPQAPANDAERLVFRQIYATLVRLDCLGQVQGSLAEGWKSEAGGTVWTFDLRPGLQFVDGGPIDAAAIRASWERRRNGGIWPWPAILDVTAVSPLALRITLDRPHPTLPFAFADPALAVTGPLGSGLLPQASGSFRPSVVASADGSRARAVRFSPADSTAKGPILWAETRDEGQDPRDALDLPMLLARQPADVMITSDVATIAYARGRPEFGIVPLPWATTYLLVSQPGTTTGTSAVLPAHFSPENRLALAREAVGIDARAAGPPFWWDADSSCALAIPWSATRSVRWIAYPAGDQTARELAERLVVLEATGGDQLRPTPLDSTTFAASLAKGDATGYIVAVSRIEPVACADVPQWPRTSTVTPLVDTRAHVIVRKGTPSFMIDGDGTIRFVSDRTR